MPSQPTPPALSFPWWSWPILIAAAGYVYVRQKTSDALEKLRRRAHS